MAIGLRNFNFGVTTLAYEMNQTSAPSTCIIGSLDFPQDGNFMAVIWHGDFASPLDDPEREIVRLEPYGIQGLEDMFNCYGGLEGTDMRDWPAGSKIAHVITAGKIDELEAEIGLKAYSAEVLPKGSVTVKTADYQMDGSETAVMVNAGVSDVTVKLPDPAGKAGRIFIIKRIDAGSANVTAARCASETIDTLSADVSLSAQWDKAVFICDGTDWYMV
jgi:hypothetical protein